LTTPEDRLKALGILDIAVAAGAWATGVADLLGVGLFTLQRWRRQFAGDGDGLDGRKGSHRLVSHRLSDEERQRILLTCNQSEFAALPPVRPTEQLSGCTQQILMLPLPDLVAVVVPLLILPFGHQNTASRPSAQSGNGVTCRSILPCVSVKTGRKGWSAELLP